MGRQIKRPQFIALLELEQIYRDQRARSRGQRAESIGERSKMQGARSKERRNKLQIENCKMQSAKLGNLRRGGDKG
jgi:hypothetical protein